MIARIDNDGNIEGFYFQTPPEVEDPEIETDYEEFEDDDSDDEIDDELEDSSDTDD